MAAGHLPHIYADRTIEQASDASNPYDLPTALHKSVGVQMFCTKVHSAMGELDRSETAASRPKRASTLKLLEIDFQELDRRLGPSRSRKYNTAPSWFDLTTLRQIDSISSFCRLRFNCEVTGYLSLMNRRIDDKVSSEHMTV